MCTRAVMTTIASSVCPKCGTIKKSGKLSCCGHGGSWFKNCGAPGTTKLHHAWYEGIQACKARVQSKSIIGQQANVVQPKMNDSSDDADVIRSKAVITAANRFELTSASTPTLTSGTTLVIMSANMSPNALIDMAIATDNASIPTPDLTPMVNMSSNINTPVHPSASTAQGCGKLLEIAAHISFCVHQILG